MLGKEQGFKLNLLIIVSQIGTFLLRNWIDVGALSV